MADSFTVTATLPASPARVFDAWTTGKGHTAMTGGKATVEDFMYGKHTAWDGYIEGVNLELDRPRRIVQTWRTSEFPNSSPDSRLEVTLEASGSGTRITIAHTDIPDGQGKQYEKGWDDHYFVPMKRYFAKGGAAKTVAKKKKEKKKKEKVSRKKKSRKKATRKKTKKRKATKKKAKQRKAAKKKAKQRKATKEKAKQRKAAKKKAKQRRAARKKTKKRKPAKKKAKTKAKKKRGAKRKTARRKRAAKRRKK